MKIKGKSEVMLRRLVLREAAAGYFQKKYTPRIVSNRRLQIELKELGLKPYKTEGKIIVPKNN